MERIEVQDRCAEPGPLYGTGMTWQEKDTDGRRWSGIELLGPTGQQYHKLSRFNLASRVSHDYYEVRLYEVRP